MTDGGNGPRLGQQPAPGGIDVGLLSVDPAMCVHSEADIGKWDWSVRVPARSPLRKGLSASLAEVYRVAGPLRYVRVPLLVGARFFVGAHQFTRPSQQGVPAIAAAFPEHRINDRIRAREVRLVDSNGTQLGIKPLPEALSHARAQDLDLVEVAPEARPPVCKIMDYAKFKYDTAQRAKESRKKATNTTIKEMKYRVKIGPGDFDTKTRQVAKFLGEGHKVKITIMFRGRENDHPELGLKILDRVVEHVEPVAKVEAAPKRDGRNMTMVLAPDKAKQQPTKEVKEHQHGAPQPQAPAAETAKPDRTNGGGPAQAVAAKPAGGQPAGEPTQEKQ